MNWIIKKLIKFFFNQLYKIRPPESVNYYKTQEAARARLVTAEDGSLKMEIKGEKYAFNGFPRGHVLTGPLANLKKKVKDLVFNQVFEEISKMTEEMKHDILPDEKCAPAIREMARVFDKLEHMEIVEDMKGRIRLIKKVLIFFLQEDDAYRLRAQYFLSEINQNKVKLDKSDKYYARGKYWKVDYDRFEY